MVKAVTMGAAAKRMDPAVTAARVPTAATSAPPMGRTQPCVNPHAEWTTMKSAYVRSGTALCLM